MTIPAAMATMQRRIHRENRPMTTVAAALGVVVAGWLWSTEDDDMIGRVVLTGRWLGTILLLPLEVAMLVSDANRIVERKWKIDIVIRAACV
jgi:hypothetical protein